MPRLTGTSGIAKATAHTHSTESSYYAAYAASLFAVTFRKAGLDCMRHYEILGAGAVPFFLGFEELERRPLSMLPFPRALVKRAMALRGVPSEAEVRAAVEAGTAPRIAWHEFDWAGYCAVRERLLAHTEAQLTTVSLARYFLDQLAEYAGLSGAPRLLFVSTEGGDYQSGVLYHGLRKLLGGRMSAWLGSDGARRAARKRIWYADHAADRGAYGRGFTYQATLPTPPVVASCGESDGERLLGELLDARLEAGYFNVLVLTTAGNGCCNLTRCFGASLPQLLNAYLARRPRTVVATVDGNDDLVHWYVKPNPRPVHTFGCHTTFEDQLSHVDVHFLREVHEDGWTDGSGRKMQTVQRPRGWVD